MFCPTCGTSNDSSAQYCLKCGKSLPTDITVASKTSQPDMEEYYRAAIGPKNTVHYLKKFKEFDERGKISAGWHWPAFLITFYWSLYRKMWRNAFIYFISPYILFIPVGILAGIAKDSPGISAFIGLAYLAYVAAIFIVPALYGDALYYKHCKNLIDKVKASTPDYQRQLGELTGRGGTSGAFLWIFLILFFVAFIGICAAIAIPAYQSYTTRAKVSQAYGTGTEIAQHVATYYSQHQAIPLTIFEAGFTGSLPPYIKEVLINQKNGTIRITMAQAPIIGKSFSLVPTLDGDAVTWQCESDEIADKFLPPNCRKPK